MITPSKCPFCNDILMTTFVYEPMKFRKEFEIKNCFKLIDHSISFYLTDWGTIKFFEIPIGNENYARWTLFPNYKFHITFLGKEITELPYFEPNLSNFGALVNKIKTYITFS